MPIRFCPGQLAGDGNRSTGKVGETRIFGWISLGETALVSRDHVSDSIGRGPMGLPKAGACVGALKCLKLALFTYYVHDADWFGPPGGSRALRSLAVRRVTARARVPIEVPQIVPVLGTLARSGPCGGGNLASKTQRIRR